MVAYQAVPRPVIRLFGAPGSLQQQTLLSLGQSLSARRWFETAHFCTGAEAPPEHAPVWLRIVDSGSFAQVPANNVVTSVPRP